MFGALKEALGGLLGSGGGGPVPTPEEVPPSGLDLESETGEASARLEGTVRLPEGTYVAREIGPEDAFEIEVAFDTGGDGRISLYIVPEYFVRENYESGEAFGWDPDASVEGRSQADYQAEVSESMNGPQYVLVDNSWRGDADPDGDVEVDLEVRARW